MSTSSGLSIPNGRPSADDILNSQVIRLKRGRLNQFGFEPAWNAYFDFYLGTKYFKNPLLKPEDVTFHLFLRKNLNDNDPAWRMPSFPDMKRRLGVSQDKIESMIDRLTQTHLLRKVSGLQQGENRANIANTYILSDPIQAIEDFLLVAYAGLFPQSLHNEWKASVEQWLMSAAPPLPEFGKGVYRNSVKPPLPNSGKHKQTYIYKQTSEIKQTTTRTGEDNAAHETCAEDDQHVVVALTDLGIAETVAHHLVSHYSAARITEKLEYLAFLHEEEPAKIKSPCGWLINAIKEDYAAPDGFISHEERERWAQAAAQRAQAEAEHASAAEELVRAQQASSEAQQKAFRQTLQAQYGTTGEDYAFWEEVKRELSYLARPDLFVLIEDAYILQRTDDTVLIGIVKDHHLRQLSHPNTQTAIKRACTRVAGSSLAPAFVLVAPPREPE